MGGTPRGLGLAAIVRCDAENPDEYAYFLAYGPEGTAGAELLRVCTTRWQIEEGFAQAKGGVGLHQDEVRTWEDWRRRVAPDPTAAPVPEAHDRVAPP